MKRKDKAKMQERLEHLQSQVRGYIMNFDDNYPDWYMNRITDLRSEIKELEGKLSNSGKRKKARKLLYGKPKRRK